MALTAAGTGGQGSGGAPAAGGAAPRPMVVSCQSDLECATGERCAEPSPGAASLRCLKACAVLDYSVLYDNCPSDGRLCSVDADCPIPGTSAGHCDAGRCIKPCNKPLPSVPCVTGVCVTIAGARIVAPDCRRGAALFCVESDGQMGHCGT